jgi:putative sigma-54 modulation protein
MQITVVGRHFDVTEPIKNYVDSKVIRLDRYSSQIKEAHVILEVQKVRHIAEMTLFMKDFKITATEESRDMYASIDKALGSLHKQLLKLRDRIKEHKARRVSRKFSLRGLFGMGGAKTPQLQSAVAPRVIKRDFQTKPMSIDEACMELDLFKDSFLVFRNSGTEKINVVYKREDGNYGLIET